jgi:hypothetical protein
MRLFAGELARRRKLRELRRRLAELRGVSGIDGADLAIINVRIRLLERAAPFYAKLGRRLSFWLQAWIWMPR